MKIIDEDHKCGCGRYFNATQDYFNPLKSTQYLREPVPMRLNPCQEIKSITGNGKTATVTLTNATSNIAVGDSITIAGNHDAGFNVTAKVASVASSPSSTTFTFVSSTNATGAGGTVTKPHFEDDFEACIKEIVKGAIDFEFIDSPHLIPTVAPKERPTAQEVVSALQASYEWTGKDPTLANLVRVPGWFDYRPIFAPPLEAEPGCSSAPVHAPGQPRSKALEPGFCMKDSAGGGFPPIWAQRNKPNWRNLAYSIPADYQWKVYETGDNTGKYIYALVPNGYGLQRDENHELKQDHPNGNYLPAKPPPESAADQLSYGDEIVNYVWPEPQDYLYIELRNNVKNNVKEETVQETVRRECFPKPADQTQTYDSSNNVMCGYFKIGNLSQIMRRLASMACEFIKRDGRLERVKECKEGIFGFGPAAPSWAEAWSSYTYPDGTKGKVFVPAHDPDLQDEADLTLRQDEADLALRDRNMFFLLYKLYQMSLVDTSKLVTGTIPITISK